MLDDLATLDPHVLGELRSLQDPDAPDFVSNLIDLFLTQGRERLNEMRDRLRAADRSGLARAAHTLKGSGGAVGARRLHAQCARLEEEVRRGAAPEAGIAEIEAEFERVRAALEAARRA